MRRLAVQLTVLALAVAPLLGCAAPLVSLSEGPREYVATDYENVLRQWTRTERLFAPGKRARKPLKPTAASSADKQQLPSLSYEE